MSSSSSSSSATAADSKKATAASTEKKEKDESSDALDEDDEFEEFPNEVWEAGTTNAASTEDLGDDEGLWADNWDDDDDESGFIQQLRTEMAKQKTQSANAMQQ